MDADPVLFGLSSDTGGAPDGAPLGPRAGADSLGRSPIPELPEGDQTAPLAPLPPVPCVPERSGRAVCVLLSVADHSVHGPRVDLAACFRHAAERSAGTEPVQCVVLQPSFLPLPRALGSVEVEVEVVGSLCACMQRYFPCARRLELVGCDGLGVAFRRPRSPDLVPDVSSPRPPLLLSELVIDRNTAWAWESGLMRELRRGAQCIECVVVPRGLWLCGPERQADVLCLPGLTSAFLSCFDFGVLKHTRTPPPCPSLRRLVVGVARSGECDPGVATVGLWGVGHLGALRELWVGCPIPGLHDLDLDQGPLVLRTSAMGQLRLLVCCAERVVLNDDQVGLANAPALEHIEIHCRRESDLSLAFRSLSLPALRRLVLSRVDVGRVEATFGRSLGLAALVLDRCPPPVSPKAQLAAPYAHPMWPLGQLCQQFPHLELLSIRTHAALCPRDLRSDRLVALELLAPRIDGGTLTIRDADLPRLKRLSLAREAFGLEVLDVEHSGLQVLATADAALTAEQRSRVVSWFGAREVQSVFTPYGRDTQVRVAAPSLQQLDLRFLPPHINGVHLEVPGLERLDLAGVPMLLLVCGRFDALEAVEGAEHVEPHYPSLFQLEIDLVKSGRPRLAAQLFAERTRRLCARLRGVDTLLERDPEAEVEVKDLRPWARNLVKEQHPAAHRLRAQGSDLADKIKCSFGSSHLVYTEPHEVAQTRALFRDVADALEDYASVQPEELVARIAARESFPIPPFPPKPRRF